MREALCSPYTSPASRGDPPASTPFRPPSVPSSLRPSLPVHLLLPPAQWHLADASLLFVVLRNEIARSASKRIRECGTRPPLFSAAGCTRQPRSRKRSVRCLDVCALVVLPRRRTRRWMHASAESVRAVPRPAVSSCSARRRLERDMGRAWLSRENGKTRE
ncbi:hypothetical protein AAT19DRAFT_11076 [Rhodotorula toruloides]|uniref:Uncharacterized protein n=1 Tax=Rhodotorula toruloides TaxID=5286 RepID=A0A2S9ZX46_RHOTO|nr:hypothetical protein AAT19DRAFT_11076 [Rhodotorula toruloides]